MPNWCHNTLTVRGERGELDHFVAAVRESAEQPLSFDKLVPQPSEEELAAIDEANKTDCRLCGGKGKRPVSQEEADDWGIEFYEGVMPVVPFEDRADCNGCDGSGRALPSIVDSAWRNWREANWGCKWDASFSEGAVMGLGDAGMDVALTKETQGVTVTPHVAIYKFDTPWAPPVPFVEQASEQFPGLEFELRYGEMGGDYAGVVSFLAGSITDEQDLPVEEVLAPEEMWF